VLCFLYDQIPRLNWCIEQKCLTTPSITSAKTECSPGIPIHVQNPSIVFLNIFQLERERKKKILSSLSLPTKAVAPLVSPYILLETESKE